MKKRTLIFIILSLAALLLTLQSLRAGARAAEMAEIEVIGIGLGAGNQREASNRANIGRREAEQLGANHPSEILNRLPGFNIQHGSGQEHLTAIRSPVLTGGAGAGSFLYLEDGVSLRAPGFANVNGLFESMAELAGNIETVRGPGSALNGSNAVHGVVNFQSRVPQNHVEGDALLRFGVNPFSTKIVLSATAPVWDEAAARIGFVYTLDNGWRNSTGIQQFKGQLRLDNRLGRVKFKTLLSALGLNQQTGGYLEGAGSYKQRALTFTNANPDAYRKARAVRGQNQALWSINTTNQLNLTTWFRWTTMDFLMHFLPGTPVEKNTHTSFGVRPIWQWQSEQLNLNVGGELEYTNGRLEEIQTNATVFSFFQGVHYDYTIDALTIALFTQNEWQLPDDRTNIHFGLRGEYVRYDYDNQTGSGTFMNATSDSSLFRPADHVDEFFTLTPKIGANYRLPKLLNHQAFIFGNYTRGARAPQTTDLYRLRYRDRNVRFKAERLDSVELGLRGKQGKLSWELLGFYQAKSRYHFRDSSAEPVVNGRTHHAGLEAQFSTPLFWDVYWRSAFTYARHWYAFDNAIRGIRKGAAIDTAPRTLLNTELGYANARGRMAIELVHVGKYYTDPENAHSYSGHNVLNFRSAVNVWRDVSLFFNIFNLIDSRYADRADFSTPPGRDSFDRYFPGQPRAYYLGLSANF